MLTRLLDDYRLVTVTGPGGVGKTRLATEVARGLADQFPDGVWLIELGAVADPARVPAELMSALGVSQDPGQSPVERLAEALAPRRLLLVLDNCEHVLPAVADVCAMLLGSADDVRILATSREQIGLGGETQYRLAPLELPGSAEPGAVGQSSAAALFIERARQADPRFAVSPEHAALVARVVARLDGIPLAIELAAARVPALGMAGLADRIDDALRLLAGEDARAAHRHRSLAAVADWSYRLLTEPERRAFRRLAVFPGRFTLEAAEAVAGQEAGPIVLRLVDCSLLMPPRPGPDERTRYTMLETLRGYALTRLREAGEEGEVTAELARYAWTVAEHAAGGLEGNSDRQLEAMRWLDAEDATLSAALGWAFDHDPDGALRLAAALAPWLPSRGRLAEAVDRLRTAVARSSSANPAWAKAQLWLGQLTSSSTDLAGALERYSAAADAYADQGKSHGLVMALVGRAVVRLNMGDDPATVHDARHALTVARDLGDTAGELQALTGLSLVAFYAGDTAKVLDWARQAEELLPSDVRADEERWSYYILATVLAETGERDAARRLCAAGLTLSRQADDQVNLGGLLEIVATLERLAGNLAEARAHLREAADMSLRNGDHVTLTNLIEEYGCLCAETGRWADAVTLWAAHTADRKRRGLPTEPEYDRSRLEYMGRIDQQLDPGQRRAAQERGARMTISAAAELAIMITSAAQEPETAEPAPKTPLSPRERELVTLVAQGHTNAQIAERLYISVRTVASHLDRIRDKTGYRRRADLTRLAIEEKLV